MPSLIFIVCWGNMRDSVLQRHLLLAKLELGNVGIYMMIHMGVGQLNRGNWWFR